jgi:aminopeptidase N
MVMTPVDTGTEPAGAPSTDRSSNLTLDDAAKRAEAIQVESYQIVVDLTDSGNLSATTFRSTTTVAFTATHGAQTFIDIAPGAKGAVRSATLNDAKIDVEGFNEDQGIPLKNLATHNSLVVEADCTYSGDGEGLCRFEDLSDKNVYLYTHFEPAAAKKMCACFDQPDLKASFTLTVVAPEDWVVVANTMATAIEASGDTKVHKFAPTARISTYLVALIAGPYHCRKDTYTDEHATIPLRIFCRQSLAQSMDKDADDLFDLTKSGFGFYQSTFDVPYPFGKYDQVFCPAFNAGAMENVAAVTFNDDQLFRGRVTRYEKARRAETLLHEMAHMWFGDLVTMKWWDDLWLNESFATWAANLCLTEATDYHEAWTTFANVEKPKAYRQDQLPTSHPVADADGVPSLGVVLENFDYITYIKGASILKQLVASIGREQFLSGLHDYFTTHEYSNATLHDLLCALKKTSGVDLQDWAQQWLRTKELNTLRPDFDVDSGSFTRFTLTQSGADQRDDKPPAYRPHHVQIGVYDDDGTGKLVRVPPQISVTITGARTEVPQPQRLRHGKLIIVNDNDDTYCALRFDPDSWRTALTRIGDIKDRLPRAQVWSTIWEMTRNGEYRPRDFASLVTSNVHAESEVAVAENLLAQVQTALTSYADPVWAREQGWPVFANRLLELAQGAQGGSDEQLAYINALGADRVKERQRSCVLSERHTQVLSALLDADGPTKLNLPGLEVDIVLQWRIVIALATAGVADADRLIDALLKSDNTEAGRLNAAQAKAARPQPDAKKALWDHMLTDKSIENNDARAMAAGFAAPGQAELLAPYTAQYFDSVVDIWNHRKEQQPVAITLVTGLYPSWDISNQAIDAAKSLLQHSDVPAPLRRLISEGRADAHRALAARTLDATPNH